MDSYKTPDNASIFNFKRIQNDFHEAIGFQEFHNKILNPFFLEMRNNNVFHWNSLLGVDVNTPSAIDLDKKKVTYLYNGLGSITQDLKLELGTQYTILIETSNSNDGALMSLELISDSMDFIHYDVLVDEIKEQLIDGITVLRFKTKENGVFGNTQLRITNNSDTEVTEITFSNIVMTVGNIALLGARYSEFDEKIRWNNTNSYWEITIDDGVTWERIWTEGIDFDNRLNDLIDQRTIGLIHQDNLIEGENITLTPSTIDDGMGGSWPAITISSTGGSGGEGTGDWTREDVYYQSLLEGSDFSHISYNILDIQGDVVLNGSSFEPDADSLGVGLISGPQGSSFETPNLIISSNSFTTFYIDAVTDNDILVEYSISNGSGFGPWVSCAFKELIVTANPFTELKVKYIFNDPSGINKIYSYGLLYGHDEISGMLPLGFLETLNINAVSGTTINIPNGRWYHKDGKSLEIFYDGIRMLEGTDYTEVNVGYPDKSYKVTFNFQLENTKTIVFKEIYGNGGAVTPSGTTNNVSWSEGLNGHSCIAFEKLMVDTTSGTVTLNLPSSAAIGDEIQIIDKHGSFSTHNLILHSSDDIMDSSNDYHLTENYTHATIVFVDNTVGWRVYFYYSFSR
jgi:hypothetical protein